MQAVVALVRMPLRSMRRSIGWWALGLAALVAVTVAFWPAFRGSSGISEAIDQLPDGVIRALGLGDFGSPAGFLRGNLYELIVPLLLALAAATLVSGQTAGEESAGRLEIILAQPIGHLAVFVGREVAAFVAVVLICLAVAIAQFGFDALFGLDIDASRVLSTIVLSGLLACLAGAVAASIAGRFPQPGLVLGVSVALILVAYLVSALFPLTSVLEPWSHLSPWNWAFGGDPLVAPAEAWRYLALGTPTLLLGAAGALAFRRRDVAAA